MSISHKYSTDDQTMQNSLDQSTNQQIQLQGNDNSNTYPIYSKETEIILSKNSSQTRINASNKIKVNKIVNYEWEQRYTHGNMIAVHKSGQYFAYSIRVDNNGKVKVFNKKLNEKVLLKSFKGRVVDLSFAHYDTEVLLGCVDETGCAQIFKIELDQDSKMKSTLVFNLAPVIPVINFTPASGGDTTNQNKSLNQSQSKPNTSNSAVNRIIWCMYIPFSTTNDPETANQPDDASKVFVLTRKNRADIFHLGLIQENYDCSKQLDASDINHGHLVIEQNQSNILAASFSPDGSAIATSSAEGEVIFYKISFTPNIDGNESVDPEETSENPDDTENENNVTPKQESPNTNSTLQPPTRLHNWHPHGDKPVTSIYFPDDHKNSAPDSQFWSYVITGADYNREIKIWCCVKWECLQVIRFLPTPSTGSVADSDAMKTGAIMMPKFKTGIDLTSTYLVMSDINRKSFYILHLNKVDNESRCTAISEYILAYPALSFAIIDSLTKKARKYNQLNNVNNTSAVSADEAGNYDSLGSEQNLTKQMMSSSSSSSSLTQAAANETDLVTMIRLYCIQTKQLQEMQIFLTGEQSTNAYNNSNSPPPVTQSQPIQPFQFNQSSNSLQHQSILNQLLPNGGSPSASRFNSSNSLSSTDNNLINSLKLNLSSNNPNRMKTSSSFNSELKDSMMKSTDINISDNDYDQTNKVTNSQSIIRSLLPNLKNCQSSNNFSEEDSAIIQIVTPTPQLGNINVLTTPVLLTPDAFTNSPTNSRMSVNGEQKQKPNDVLQSLMSGNGVSSMNVTNSNNLLSSRASSLTHVTAATNLIPAELPAYTETNINNLSTGSQNSQKKLKTKKEKKFSPLHRKRNDSSSSSCSSCSSSCSSSGSSTGSSSIMDSADKEIAALSSSGNNKLVAQIGSVSNASLNKIKLPKNNNNSTSLNTSTNKIETLLNKVSIENDDSFVCQQNKRENQDDSYQMPLPTRSFGLQQQLNQSWPMPPIKNNFASTDASKQFSEETSNDATTDLNANMTELKMLLIQMTQAMRSQHEEIESLKKHQLNSQAQLKSHIDTSLNKFSQRNQSQQPLVADENQLSNLIQQNLTKNLQPKLEKIIKEEIHKSVQNQFVTRVMEPLREQITRDLAEKLKSIEAVLKDNVNKMFKSKTTLDALSQSIVSSQQATIINSYRDTFQKVIVPNFEKSCQNMYQQVNASFSKGTQNYLLEFETLAKQHSKKFDETKEPILAQMSRFNEQMSNHSTQMASVLGSNLQQQFESNLRDTNAILQDTIISSVKAIIKEEIHLAMRDQQQTLPGNLISQMRQSGTMTPLNVTPGGSADIFNQRPVTPSQDLQASISKLLKQGQLNVAFQKALCAADLTILENLCDIVSPSQAFDPLNNNPRMKLQQPVILSLIQQLSQELNQNTDVKVKYLEEAVVNLDLSVPLTMEHSPMVIGALISKLQQYVQSYPNDKYTKPMRMLTLASKSLLSSSQKPQTMQYINPSQNTNTTNSNLNRMQTNSNGNSFASLSNHLKKNILNVNENYSQ